MAPRLRLRCRVRLRRAPGLGQVIEVFRRMVKIENAFGPREVLAHNLLQPRSAVGQRHPLFHGLHAYLGPLAAQLQPQLVQVIQARQVTGLPDLAVAGRTRIKYHPDPGHASLGRVAAGSLLADAGGINAHVGTAPALRSEERRVGKETRSMWWAG